MSLRPMKCVGDWENQYPLSFPFHGHNLSVASIGMDIRSAVFELCTLPVLHKPGRSWVSFAKWLQVRFGLLETKVRYIPRTLGLETRTKQGHAVGNTVEEPLCFHDVMIPVSLVFLSYHSTIPVSAPHSPYALLLYLTLCYLLLLEGHQSLS